MNIKLLPKQYEFIENQNRFCLFLAGLGSGKSYAGSVYILKRVVDYPDALHFIGTNTYSQLRDSTLAAMFSLLTDLEIEFTYNQNHGMLEFLGGKVLCKSLENFNTLRGIEIASAWLDESRDMKKEAFTVLMGRLRDKHCDSHQIRLTSTPAGFNWMYDYFAGELKTDDFYTVKARTTDNKHLPDGYYESLLSQYDSQFAKQELDAEFIQLNQGQVYRLDRDRNIKEREREAGRTIWCGMDFNVDPMSAVIGHVYGNSIHIIDEFFLRNSDTRELCNEIRSKYGKVHVVPDSTGSKRTTAGGSSVTDHSIIKDHHILEYSTNPFRKDRYNCVNKLLEDGALTIHPRCKNLIKDLEQLSFKEGTDIPDVSGGKNMLGHKRCCLIRPSKLISNFFHERNI